MWPFTRKNPAPIGPVLEAGYITLIEKAAEAVEVARVREGLCQCGKIAAMTQAGPGKQCVRCILRGVEHV